MDFSRFDRVYDNAVYSVHDYCGFGFPNRIRRYQGKPEQNAYIRKMYDRKAEFMRKNNVPIWNGEFGPIYEKEETNPDWEVHNQERYNMLEKQLEIYTADSIGKWHHIHMHRAILLTVTFFPMGAAWSIWTYKDLNTMGLVHMQSNAPWIKLLGPIIKKKRQLAVNSWAYDDAHLQEGLFGPLHKWFEDNVPSPYGKKYPWQWRMNMHVFRGIRGITMAEYMIPEWANYFRDKSFEELDALAASWKFENCMIRDELDTKLKLYSTMQSDDKRLVGNVILPSVDLATEGVFELSPEEKERKK